MRRIRSLFPMLVLALCAANADAADGKNEPGKPPKVGACAPDFKLDDHEGKPVTLSGYRGKENVLLIFYRGSF